MVGAITAVNAQTYKIFKVDVSGGIAVPFGKGTGPGPLLAIEPKLALSDAFSLGFRFEGAFIVRGVAQINGDYADFSVKHSSSYLVTGDYYLNKVSKNERFRPFIGVGIGDYHVYDGQVIAGPNGGNWEDVDWKRKNEIGGMIRAGFEYAHFRMGVEYNAVSGDRNSYLGVKLGICIGGGRKAKQK